MIEQMGGRKFILALIILGVGTLVQLKSGVNESFVALLVGIMAAFGASNAFVTSRTVGAAGEADGAPQPNTELEQRLAQIEQNTTEAVVALNEKAEQIAGALNEVAKSAETASKLAKAALGVQK
jgi:hypothetical protein